MLHRNKRKSKLVFSFQKPRFPVYKFYTEHLFKETLFCGAWSAPKSAGLVPSHCIPLFWVVCTWVDNLSQYSRTYNSSWSFWRKMCFREWRQCIKNNMPYNYSPIYHHFFSYCNYCQSSPKYGIKYILSRSCSTWT